MSVYNLKNPAVKRLMKEAEELHSFNEEYHAQPLEDNLFEWHFTIRGPPNTDFEGGVYHGRITLPPDYPMKPPSILLLTPNGRFETNKKVCLSISGYHPESWQPSWSIRTALLAIIAFLPSHGNGAIGSLDYTSEERKLLALKSQKYICTVCGLVQRLLNHNIKSESVNKKETHIFEEKQLHEVHENISKSDDSGYIDDSPLVAEANTSLVNINDSVEPSQEKTDLNLRQRPTVKVENDTEMPTARNHQRSSSSFYSLLFIWLIIFFLVVLILRRICF